MTDTKEVPKMKILKGASSKVEETTPVEEAPVAKVKITKPEVEKVDTTDAESLVQESVITDETDMIATVEQSIEQLNEDQAFSMVPSLLNNIDQTYFRLGGVLHKIQSQGWYLDKGYDNFRAYVESEGGMAYRKAMYLISIYTNLTSAGVSWNSVSALGWTILKDLAAYLTTENVDEWVEALKNMTVLQAQEYIKAKTAASDGPNNNDDTVASSSLTTITFKVHADQKETIKEAIAKNKHEAGTEFDSVALENICINYLASDTKVPKKAAKVIAIHEQLIGLGIEAAIETFNKAYPDANLSIEPVGQTAVDLGHEPAST